MDKINEVNQLRDRIIDAGIAEIRAVGYPDHKLRGAIAGMEMCRKFSTLPEYRQALNERHTWELEWPKEGEGDIKEYWEYRMATTQIEFVFEVMRVAWRDSGPYSAKALLCYQKYSTAGEINQGVFSQN